MTQIILIAIFLLLPWIKIGGQQAVLLDLPGRKFALFGVTFWAHDAPMIFFVLAILTMSLALMTALWGRVWCGWACPQTVFIDGVFRRIEELIEGNHIERRKLDDAPMDAKKFFKRSLKWILFTAVTLVITHSFLAYFVGADRLVEMVQHKPAENWTNFLIILVTSGIILFDFAWFREQFCIIACPYGRFQSVLMGPRSKNVVYDYNRGEPRKGKAPKGEEADCVNCYRCVQVCPTGVDIRRGTQMECIACTACIDACDEIMEKVNKPKGLIRYDSERNITENRTSDGFEFRPRIALYAVLLVAAIAGMSYSLNTRQNFHLAVIRGEEPFSLITQSDGTEIVTNHFKIHLNNQSFDDVKVELTLPKQYVDQQLELVSPINPVDVPAGGDMVRTHIFIKSPKSFTLGKGQAYAEIEMTIKEKDKTETVIKQISLLGPNQ